MFEKKKDVILKNCRSNYQKQHIDIFTLFFCFNCTFNFHCVLPSFCEKKKKKLHEKLDNHTFQKINYSKFALGILHNKSTTSRKSKAYSKKLVKIVKVLSIIMNSKTNGI